MSVAERVANEQTNEAKRFATSTAKVTLKKFREFIKNLKEGFDPDLSMKDFHNKAMDRFDLSLKKLQDNGTISKDDAMEIQKDVQNRLGKFKDLEDGCNKSSALDNISKSLENFKPGDDVGQLKQTISNFNKAPDMLRMAEVPKTPEMGKVLDAVNQRSGLYATGLKKECGVFRVRKQHLMENAKAIQAKTKKASQSLQSISKTTKTVSKAASKVAKTAAKTSAKVAGKAGAQAILGVTTLGIGNVIHLGAEITTALAKTAGKVTKEAVNTKGIDEYARER